MNLLLKGVFLCLCIASITCIPFQRQQPKLNDLQRIFESNNTEVKTESKITNVLSVLVNQTHNSTELNRHKRQLAAPLGFRSYDYGDYYGGLTGDYNYDYYDWVCSESSCQLCNILGGECCDPDGNPNCFLPDTCLNNPCLAGGSCVTTRTIDDRPDFLCICLPGLTGKYCQITNDYIVDGFLPHVPIGPAFPPHGPFPPSGPVIFGGEGGEGGEGYGYPSPAPYQPQPAPYQPQPAPYQPQPAPYQPQPAPYQAQPAPYQPQAAPYQPQPAPYQTQPAPYQPQPEQFQPQPEQFQQFQQQPVAPFLQAPYPYNQQSVVPPQVVVDPQMFPIGQRIQIQQGNQQLSSQLQSVTQAQNNQGQQGLNNKNGMEQILFKPQQMTQQQGNQQQFNQQFSQQQASQPQVNQQQFNQQQTGPQQPNGQFQVNQQRTAQPQVFQQQIAQPQAIQQQIAQPQVIQPLAIQPQAIQPQAIQPQAIQPQAIQSQAIQPQVQISQTQQGQSGITLQRIAPQQQNVQRPQVQSFVQQPVVPQTVAQSQMNVAQPILTTPQSINQFTRPQFANEGAKLLGFKRPQCPDGQIWSAESGECLDFALAPQNDYFIDFNNQPQIDQSISNQYTQ